MDTKEAGKKHLRLRAVGTDDSDTWENATGERDAVDLDADESDGDEIRPARRNRWQLILAGVCVIGILGGARLARNRARESGNRLWNESALTGTWELKTVGNDPVGPDKDSAVLSQRVTFTAGKLRGETHLRGDVPATAALPFPDASVHKVQSSLDGHDITVTWDGTYTVEDNGRIGLHVGKAFYFALGSWRNGGQTLQFDHDLVLTYQGATRYQPASDAPSHVAGL